MAETKQQLKLSQIAYQLYQKDWVDRHISEERQRDVHCEYAEDVEDCKENGIIPQSFEDWLEEYGYQGELYVCYDEFYQSEYRNCPDYISSLLEEEGLINLYRKERKKEGWA